MTHASANLLWGWFGLLLLSAFFLLAIAVAAGAVEPLGAGCNYNIEDTDPAYCPMPDEYDR